jgi:cation transport ATPase
MTTPDVAPQSPRGVMRSIHVALGWVSIAVLFVVAEGTTRMSILPEPLDYVVYQGAVLAAVFAAVRGRAVGMRALAVTAATAALFFSAFVFVHMSCPSP